MKSVPYPVIDGRETLALTGRHPYMGRAASVQIAVPVLASPPGATTTLREMATQSPRRFETPGKLWVAVAGPYRIEAGRYSLPDARITETVATLERDELLSAIWDMSGRPMRPGLSRRPAASWALVREPGGLTIYRDASEVASSMADGIYREAAAPPPAPRAAVKGGKVKSERWEGAA